MLQKSPAKKTTPKTTGKSSTKLMQSEKKSPLTIPNLRLEAKLTAEVGFCVVFVNWVDINVYNRLLLFVYV